MLSVQNSAIIEVARRTDAVSPARPVSTSPKETSTMDSITCETIAAIDQDEPIPDWLLEDLAAIYEYLAADEAVAA